MKANVPSSRATARAPRPRSAQSHEIRIIGGQWKRTKLKVADKPGLRPTPDRVRETVFNWLGQELDGLRCLDAFAGTGALGLEAASRGAAQVLLVEQDGALVEQLKALQAQLKAEAVRVQRGDGISALRQAAPGSLDVVFIDPPFDAGLFDSALQAGVAALAPEGWIYLEAPTAYTDEQLAPLGLVLHRHLKAGMVHAHLLRRTAA
ncbi:16S rRNA (guanine(966)-N(2))-methyltransferase RsmD [uncultured Rhodoferax sp.]|uniref:16S rRNA (guanine(966)-N(2))-methyltransferase RsmD n=1 Tax=uncultured Rhodoferax sp. TaxID=223188 RepID=UPI0025E22827|nr:16S rRNA (guanine(966)-N(2))-methyltransferase RsmD [uncultured Rhodoferax sp.]